VYLLQTFSEWYKPILNIARFNLRAQASKLFSENTSRHYCLLQGCIAKMHIYHL